MRFYFVIIFSTIYYSLFSQVTVKCKVLSNSGQSISNAIIQELETDDYYLTDIDGNVELEILFNKSQLNLRVSAMGYTTKDTIVDFSKKNNIKIILYEGIELNEIMIVATKPFKRKTAAIVPLSQIKSTPVLFGEPDVFRALQTLPGISFGVEGSSDLIVRGGNVGENLILIDGMPTYISSHLLGLISPFDADIVKNVKVYKGGFSAQYGGKLSSVIDIQTKGFDDMRKKLSLRTGLLTNSIYYSDKLTNDIKFTLVGRRTLLDLISRGVNALSGDKSKQIPFFYDYFGKLSLRITSNSFVDFSYIGNNDYFHDENSKGIDKSEWSTPMISLKYRFKKGKTKFSTSLLKSGYNYIYFEKLKMNENYEPSLEYKTNNTFTGIYTDVDYKINNKLSLYSGASFEERKYNIKFLKKGFSNTKLDSIIKYSKFLHSFVSINYEGGGFSADIGAHFLSMPELAFRTYIEPRAYISYSRNSQKIYGTFSIMHQTDHLVSNRSIGNYLKTWLPADEINPPSSAWETSLGYSYSTNVFQVNAELYLKKRIGLLHSKEGDLIFINTSNIENLLNNGIGTSYGFELNIGMKLGNNNRINLSYTYAKSNLLFSELNRGIEFSDYFDRRHSLFLSYEYNVNKKWKLTSAFTFNSGTPFTYIEGIYPIPGFDDQSLLELDNSLVNYIPEINNKRMPVYHRLDITANKKLQIRNKNTLLSFGVYNVYARTNPLFIRKDIETKVININEQISQVYTTKANYNIVSYFNFIPFVSLKVDLFNPNIRKR